MFHPTPQVSVMTLDQDPALALSLLRATLDATADGILVVDRRGAVTAYNATFAAMWGIPAEVLAAGTDRVLLDHVRDRLADPAEFLRTVESLYATPLASTDDELALRDGRVFERASRPQVVGDQPVGRVWSFRDVTAARAAARERAASERRLRVIFDHSGIGLAELTPDGRFVTANATLQQLTGYTLDELVRRRFHDITFPADLAAHLARHADAVARGLDGYELDKRYVRKDGSVVHVHLTMSIIRDDTGAVERLVPVVRDVTDARAAAEALARSERRLAEAQRLAGLGSFRFDPRTRLVESSAEHRRIYGLPDDAGPTPSDWFRDACVDEDRARVDEVWARVTGQRASATTAYRIRRTDGAVRNLEVQVAWQRTDDGIEELVGTARDVTERDLLQARLALSDRMASLGVMAAGVAHEINNPLATLTGNLDLLAEAPAVVAAPALRAPLRDMAEAAERIRGITRDLQLFARAADESHLSFDLTPIVDAALRLAANELRHRAAVVRRYGPAPQVRGNPARLGQAFLALVLNAAHAIDEGHVERHRVTVTIGTGAGGEAIVEIADTGRGLTAAQRDDLFRPFAAGRPSVLGTGLGMAICHRIIDELGGTIEVDSEVGRGATFRVRLPASPIPVVAPPAPAPPPPAPAPARARVLVIDDEPMVGNVVRRALAAHDVTVMTAATDALAAIADGAAPDVILCDVMMPSVTGPEFYRRLAEVAPALRPRVVFMTGGAFTAATQAFLDESGAPRLDKPLDLRRLRATVLELAARR